MDTSAQFVSIAKRILRELSALNQAVSAGFLGVQKQVETLTKGQKSQNEHQQAQSVVRPEIKILRPINAEKEAREARNEKRDRWKLRIEGATFLAVFAYAIINYHMLGQMRETNKATSDSFSKTLGEMKAQTSAQQIAADAAKREANIGTNQLELSERPWVSIKEISINEPLRFDAKGALISTIHVLRNTGHSPGMHVKWKSQLMTVNWFKGINTEISIAQDALCQRVRDSSPLFENTIFPDDKITQSDGIDLPFKDIDAALKHRESEPEPLRGTIELALVACIDYQFSFAPGHHQTKYVFLMGTPARLGWWNDNIKPEGVPPGIVLRLFSQFAD